MAYQNSWTLDTIAGRGTLDAGLWTLEAGLWTRDYGRWTLDSVQALGSEHWIFLSIGVPSFWLCLLSRIFCREYVLAWLVLEFLNKRYVLHYKRTPAEKIAIWVTGFDQKNLSSTVQNKPSRAIHFRKFLKKTPLKKRPSLEKKLQSNSQSSHFVLKWHHQECFLGNLLNFFRTPRYYSLQRWIIFIGIGDILFPSNIYFHEEHFSWNHICSVSSQKVFFLYNNILISIKKDLVQQKDLLSLWCKF